MQGYIQREREAKRLRRITRVAKIISLLILVGIPFTLGFITGRVTKQEAPTTPYQIKAEVESELPEYVAPEYKIPDPCGLAVVVCDGEPDYVPPTE